MPNLFKTRMRPLSQTADKYRQHFEAFSQISIHSLY